MGGEKRWNFFAAVLLIIFRLVVSWRDGHCEQGNKHNCWSVVQHWATRVISALGCVLVQRLVNISLNCTACTCVMGNLWLACRTNEILRKNSPFPPHIRVINYINVGKNYAGWYRTWSCKAHTYSNSKTSTSQWHQVHVHVVYAKGIRPNHNQYVGHYWLYS